MKNIMSHLIVVFSLLGFQLAYASECDSKSPVKVSDLVFIGEPLTSVLSAIGKGTSCSVVQGVNTDDAARKICKTRNMAAVNPGNPQYVGKNAGHGTRGDNRIGYYFCMPLKKRQMCEYMIGKKSATMDIRWQDRGSKGDNNGDCLCKRKGDSVSEEVECPADPTSLEVATECPIPLADRETGKCACKNDPSLEVKPGVKCPAQARQEPPQEGGIDPADLDECVADLRAAKEICSDKGKAAIDKCSKSAPEVNKNISEAQRVLSIGLDALMARNAGTGALESCAKMGATGTAVIEALSLLRENCKTELNSCKKGCEDVKALSEKTDQQYIDECKAKFQARQPAKQWDPRYQAKLLEILKVEKSQADNTEKFCKGNVESADGQLENFLQDLALSVQKADICKCQLTTGSVGTVNPETCESVMTPLTCMQNINQSGCTFSSVGCAPGSTVAGCRNPVNATNPNGSGVAMPASGFAGAGFGSTGSGGSNAGKVNVGDSDLGGFYDESRPSGSGTATADNGSPFGSAQSSGGSGGGPPGSADGGGAGSGKEGDDEKSGLAAFFQSAKGGIANMFGGGSGDKGSGIKKPDNKAFKNDVNGFRPKVNVRGMANASEFGSKNRDIWKTMNERYTDQYHTFITVETPSK